MVMNNPRQYGHEQSEILFMTIVLWVPLLKNSNSPWSSTKNFRFRKFSTKILDHFEKMDMDL
jgi:hypothetical protein